MSVIERLQGHAIQLSQLFDALSTSDKGLSSAEVESRLAKYGLNEIPKVKGSIWQVYLAPLFNWLITTYLVMTGILIILAITYPDAWSQVIMWLGIVAINFAIAIVQQSRAQKKLDALHKLAPAMTKTIRDYKVTEIPTEMLVPGDIIELAQGDRIAADARILKSNVFMVNEASLTGESVPITKVEDGEIVLEEDASISERKNMVYRGTFVQMGSAQAVVVDTGAQTEIGRIQTELSELNTGEIPLRDKVNTLGRALTIAAVTFLLIQLVWLIISWDDEMELAEELVNAVITSMSVMPINIPLLTTIVLLTGVLAMASRRVIIRNLGAIESLGRISILCSDKTGTITKSQMTIKRIWVNEQLYGVTGLGYGPSGVIYPLIAEPDEEMNESVIPDDFMCCPSGSALELLVISGMLNNDAELIIEDYVEVTGQTSWKHTGSPTDAALQALFNKTSMDNIEVMKRYQVEREYPFDSSLKRMSKLFKEKDKGYIVFSKGATEMMLPRCTRMWTKFGFEDMTPDKSDDILHHVNLYAMLGYRVLSFAFKQIGVPPGKGPDERETIESDLIYLGFVCLVDPPREDVREAVTECRNAGIMPIMITGDSMVTGGTIAKNVGILGTDQNANEGKMADKLEDDDFKKTVVFGRVSPQDKQVIVERYQGMNRVVAMTGDGVNDALALSMADAGIAMGIAGTDVAKQASDIIITDDAFSSIVTGVREGRGLFHKIRIMIFFYICVNLAEGLLYFVTSFNPEFELLTPWQKIYIFSIAHTLPPLAIIFDRYGKDIMNRSPIDGEGIFSRRLISALLLTAGALSLVIAIVYFFAEAGIIEATFENTEGFVPGFLPVDWSLSDWQLSKARTMMHTIIYLCESVLVLSIRRIDKSLLQSFKEDRYWLAYLFVLSLPLLHIFIMYNPPIQDFLYEMMGIDFDVIQLTLVDWGICAIAASIPIIVIEVYKWECRRKGLYF
ncbi:MAG: cation-translocating P-type ATPase [Candidatus Hodarchaeota archaeon]